MANIEADRVTKRRTEGRRIAPLQKRRKGSHFAILFAPALEEELREKTELPNLEFGAKTSVSKSFFNLGFVSPPTPSVDLQKNLVRNNSFSPCSPASPDRDELSGLTWFPKKKSIARLVRSVWPFELLTEGAKKCGNKLLNSPHGGQKMRHLCRDL